MDRRFEADNEWYISPLIKIKSFLEEAWQTHQKMRSFVHLPHIGLPGTSNVISDESRNQIVECSLSQSTSCSSQTAKKICKMDLRLENLTNNDPLSNMEFNEKTNDGQLRAADLRTHHYLEERNKWCKASKQRKSAYVTALKYDRNKLEPDSSESTFEKDLLESHQVLHPNLGPAEKDIVLFVTAMSPYNKLFVVGETRGTRLIKPQAKFQVRGDTLLYDLRQKLTCVCDTVVLLEDKKELEPPDLSHSCAELFPSSFIFINDTFYYDKSHPRASDISIPIREFMQKKSIFDPVKAVDMQGVKFADLELRLGMPYVFQHSGTCEHLIVFHDLRLLHAKDNQNAGRYPITIFERVGDRKCDSCKKTSATYTVEYGELMPRLNTMMCDNCFQEFNFTNGIKKFDFRAWPYFESNRLNLD